MDETAPHLQHGQLTKERLHWYPEMGAKRMRWVFFMYGKGRRGLNKLAAELAPAGYRVRELRVSRRGEGLMVITVLKQLSLDQLRAEVRRLRAASDRLGLFGVDALDAEDPVNDHLWVN